MIFFVIVIIFNCHTPSPNRSVFALMVIINHAFTFLEKESGKKREKIKRKRMCHNPAYNVLTWHGWFKQNTYRVITVDIMSWLLFFPDQDGENCRDLIKLSLPKFQFSARSFKKRISFVLCSLLNKTKNLFLSSFLCWFLKKMD